MASSFGPSASAPQASLGTDGNITKTAARVGAIVNLDTMTFNPNGGVNTVTVINDSAGPISTAASLAFTTGGNFVFGESGDTSANNISFTGTAGISADLNRTVTINGSNVTVSSASVWSNTNLNSRTLTVNGASNTFEIAGIAIGATGEVNDRNFTVAGDGNLRVTGGITNQGVRPGVGGCRPCAAGCAALAGFPGGVPFTEGAGEEDGAPGCVGALDAMDQTAEGRGAEFRSGCFGGGDGRAGLRSRGLGGMESGDSHVARDFEAGRTQVFAKRSGSHLAGAHPCVHTVAGQVSGAGQRRARKELGLRQRLFQRNLNHITHAQLQSMLDRGIHVTCKPRTRPRHSRAKPEKADSLVAGFLQVRHKEVHAAAVIQ